jgi:transcriptional regulator with GAF, ATPase, and Fis domain
MSADRISDDNLLHSAMVELTSGTPDLERSLAGVTAAAVQLMAGVDYADVMLIGEGRFQSLAETTGLVVELDAAQLRLQQGPCLQAADGEMVVRCPDLGTDSRWPQFAEAAMKAGVHSMLSFQLYAHQSGAGALNLFGRTAGVFDAQTETIGALLATHAAIALMAADKQRQFEAALASRDSIGQAKGIVMERFSVNAVRAFAMLTKLSQESNTPVTTIAQQTIDTSRADGPLSQQNEG